MARKYRIYFETIGTPVSTDRLVKNKALLKIARRYGAKGVYKTVDESDRNHYPEKGDYDSIRHLKVRKIKMRSRK